MLPQYPIFSHFERRQHFPLSNFLQLGQMQSLLHLIGIRAPFYFLRLGDRNAVGIDIHHFRRNRDPVAFGPVNYGGYVRIGNAVADNGIALQQRFL